MSEQTGEIVPQESAGPPAVQMEKNIHTQVYELVTGSNRAYCTDDDSAGRCVDLDKRLQVAGKKISDRHKELTEGLTATKRGLDAEKKDAIDALDAARTHVQGLIKVYRAEQKRLADALAAKEKAEAEERALADAQRLQDEGKEVEAERVIEEAAELTPQTAQPTGPVRGHTAGTASFKDEAQFEVEDADKVPREFCSPDPSKIRKAIRREQDPVREIEGVKIWVEEKMRNA